MTQVLARRALLALPTLFLVSIGVFSLTALVPGDAAASLAGVEATREEIEALRQALNLDDPFLVRYRDWLFCVLQLDLGTSFGSKQPVADEILRTFPVTLQLTVATIVVGLVIAIPVGMLAGIRAGGTPDSLARVFASVVAAIPTFWLGPLLLIVLAVWWGLVPAGGFVSIADDPREFVLRVITPALTLGLGTAAVLIRQLRSALIDSLESNSVRTMWAVGASSRVVIGKHALRNAAIPAVTMFGIEFGGLVGGSVITEQIFGIPGLGSLALRAVVTRDVPLIQGVVLFVTVLVVLTNLIIDIAYALLNPKVKIS